MRKLKGRQVYGGVVEGEAIVTNEPVAFCAGIDPLNGKITERGHELSGKKISNKILVCPSGKGSSAFSKAAYAVWLAGKAPIGCIFEKIDPKTALASIVMRAPTITDLNEQATNVIKSGDYLKINAEKGEVVIIDRMEGE